MSSSLFDLFVTPPVKNGAYSAGQIQGGLLQFDVGDNFGDTVMIQRIELVYKSAVQPTGRIIIFGGQPTAGTYTDQTAYSLNASDAFHLRGSYAIGSFVNHGTPKSMQLVNLALPVSCGPNTKSIYMLVVDDTGVTLTSTGDLLARVSGVRQ